MLTTQDMEKFVATYTEGVATGVLNKIGQLLIAEYQLVRGVRGEVVLLRDDVATMNSLLRMLAEADEGTVSHFYREWMRQVRELSYDAEDDIDFFVRRIDGVAPIPIWSFFVGLWHRRSLGHDIKDLLGRALAISERRTRYAVSNDVMKPSIVFSPSPITGVSSSTIALIGGANDDDDDDSREDESQSKALSDKLMSITRTPPSARVGENKKAKGKEIVEHGEASHSGTPSAGKTTLGQAAADGNLQVFAIVGFGGVGKTTLAMKVLRRLKKGQDQPKFEHQASVSVSQAFDTSKDMKRLLKQILEQVMKEKDSNYAEMDVKQLTDKLKEFLQDKRYLIVIDDVWTTKAWEAIRVRLPENKKDSRIIVTTRINTVAKACIEGGPNLEDYIHEVKPLESKDSEDLFDTRVFGPNERCPEQLKKARDDILKKCGGIPLAIISIASLFVNYKSPECLHKWEGFCGSMGSQIESNPALEGMRQSITLSYNHLPHELKACMMYVSIFFLENYMIPKHRLLSRWIAEGLIPEKRGLTSLEVAQNFADELVSRNMIQESTHYHVHGIMLELILSKSLEENFVSCLVGGQGGRASYYRVRRLSIKGHERPLVEQKKDDSAGSSFVQQMDMGHVRSLTTFCPQGHIKILDRVKEFTLLRVLDLEDCEELKDDHLKHICRLFLLRFLNLNNTNITKLPNQIGDLLHLQTLGLYDTLLEKVPGTVTKLQNLENLSFYNRKETWAVKLRLPRGLRRMRSLTGLTMLELKNPDAQIAEEIGDLVQLRKLHVVLNTNPTLLEKLAKCTGCYDPPLLQKFAKSISSIRQSLRDLSVEDTEERTQNMEFLHQLDSSPPLLLRRLTIGGKIDKLPTWVDKSLIHLTEVMLWWIELPSDQIFDPLCKLPNLLKIILDRKCCCEDALVAKGDSKFEKLKELHVVPYGEDTEKPKVLRFEKGSMDCLQLLEVKFEANKRTLDGVENLTSLRKVNLDGTEDAREEAFKYLENINKLRDDPKQRFEIIVPDYDQNSNADTCTS